LLADFEREFRVKTAEHFFANGWVHHCEFAHEFVARLPFSITTPADADGQQRGYCPNGDISSGDQKRRMKLARKSLKREKSASRAVIAKLPMAMQESMNESMQMMKPVIERVQQMQQEMVAEMKKTQETGKGKS
jgi:hypothetical protein